MFNFTMTDNTLLTPTQKNIIAAFVFFIIPISGVSVDIYLPSLPAITHYFGVEKSLAQLSITYYLIGIGTMQLFAGSISDSFGRKKPFIFSMFCYLIVTLLVPLVTHIHYLLFLRLLQGILIGVFVVPLRSVISDLFEGKEFYKMMSYMTICWTMGPIIAPVIGGYLQHYFGWKANFYFLLGYGLIAFIAILIYVPETSQHRHPFHLIPILKRYKEILLHREYAASLLINSLLYSFIIIFATVGPFLIQVVLHYSPIEFGRIVLLTGFAWFIGALTNRFLLHINLRKKVTVCLWSTLAISIIAVTISLHFPLNIYAIVIPFFILFWISGIVFPNFFARGLGLFPHSTGSANALFGGGVFLISSGSSFFATFLKSTSELPLMYTYVGIISLCLIINYFGFRERG